MTRLGPRQRHRPPALDGYTLHASAREPGAWDLYPGLHRTLSVSADVRAMLHVGFGETVRLLCANSALRFKLFLEEHIHWSFGSPRLENGRRFFFFAAYRAIVGESP